MSDNFKPILMSGKCREGEIGKLTPLIDDYEYQLYVGDLVAISNYDGEDIFNDYHGVQFVCEEIGDCGTELGEFVMGIASEHNHRNDIITQNSKKWRIRRVKKYTELVNGEKWGGVRAVFKEE